MTVTGLINLNNIKEELVVFLRNADVFTIGSRGVATITEEFDGDAAETEFTLTNTPVRNVRSVTVGGSPIAFGSGYTVDYSTAVVTFASAPGSGTDNVDIQYDYGNTEKIYPDFPRVDLSISSYPRIATAIVSTVTEDGGVGGAVNVTEFLISVTVYADGMENVDTYINSIREAFLDAKKSFYYLRYIKPSAQSALINEPARGNKIYQRTIDFLAPHNYETIT